jgi:hypothetical protein
MSRGRSLRRGFAAALLAMVVAAPGCDIGEEAASAECARIGARCQLADGPLGVCQERPCEAGRAAPCFACTAQH